MPTLVELSKEDLRGKEFGDSFENTFQEQKPGSQILQSTFSGKKFFS